MLLVLRGRALASRSNSAKFTLGSQIEWRGLRWHVEEKTDAALKLIPVQAEVRAAIKELYVQLETIIRSEDVTSITPSTIVIPPPENLPEAWNPKFLLTKLSGELRHISAPSDRLLWAPSVPLTHHFDRQLVPLKIALEQDPVRLLIADDVGLGKTTEAALIVCELLARKKIKRVLVIAPSHLVERKWEPELNRRFGLCFQVMDGNALENTRRNLALTGDQNPFAYVDRAIVSVDWAKEGYVKPYLCDKEQSARWDLVIIDECHRIARRGKSESSRSLRYKLAHDLAQNTDGLILMSATPHDGDDQSFSSLVELLETSNTSNRLVKPVMVRRLRRDIPDDEYKPGRTEFVRFNPSKEWLSLSESLQILCDSLKSESYGHLVEITLFKRFLSSPYAVGRTLGLLKDIGHDVVENSSEETEEESLGTLEQLGDDPKYSKSLKDIKSKLDQFIRDSKLDSKLLSLIEVLSPVDSPVVINSEFVDTLIFLQHQLQKSLKGRKILLAHGGLSKKEIDDVIKEFKGDAILLASDVLSEGVDLQEHCHRLIHFDLPFRPYRIEQRNGRIDRVGQKKNPVFQMLVPSHEKLETVDHIFGKKTLGLTRMYEFLENQRKQLGSLNEVFDSSGSFFQSKDSDIYKELADFKPGELSATKNPKKANAEIIERCEAQAFEQLTWSGQSDLGFDISVIKPMTELVSEALSKGLYRDSLQLRNFKFKGDGANDLYHALFSSVSVGVEASEFEWAPRKDFLQQGGEFDQAITFGHEILTQGPEASSLWSLAELNYDFSSCNVAALESSCVNELTYLFIWQHEECTQLSGITKKGIRLHDDAIKLICEKLFSMRSVDFKVPSTNKLKSFTQDIVEVYLKHLEYHSKGGARTELLGLLCILPEGGRS